MNRLGLWIVSAVVLASCRSAPLRVLHAEAPALSPRAASVEPLRVATFNAGLAPGAVRDAAARAPEVVAAITREELDVLCVQEFWLEEHWEELRAATRARLPHAVRPIPRLEQRPKPCTAAEIAPAARCALEQCRARRAAEAAECAVARCGSLAGGLSAACVGCLASQPLRPITEILDQCVDADREHAASPDAKGPVFFDGSYGIGLLSSMQLSDVDRLELEASHHSRAVLHARIAYAGQRLHVFCTHLTPILRSVPHPGGGSWLSEQSRQVDAMLEWITRQAGDEPALIMGDLNTGPASAAARARAPEHYERLLQSGFVNPYLASAGAACTFCYDNPVIGGGSGGLLIDHILVRGWRGHIEANRFLDGRVELDLGGRRTTSALSDHYGVLAVLAAR